jgi:hypothetical protein
MLDIETAPNTAYVWGLWDQNISHNHMTETSYMLCWSAKWYGSKTSEFMACKTGPRQDKDGYIRMLDRLHVLLNEADVVVHYYGSKFDIPKTFKEFVQQGWRPPSPFKQIDLKILVQRIFKFESNKLDHVSQMLFGEQKIKTDFQLWIDCMKGDAKAWRDMEKYNRHDVFLLERLYTRLLPWIDKHPTWGAMKAGLCCPKCGCSHVQSRGTQVAQTRTYTRYQCQRCGGWFRGNKAVGAGWSLRGLNIAS